MQIDTGTSERTEAAADHAHDMGRSIVDDRVFSYPRGPGPSRDQYMAASASWRFQRPDWTGLPSV
jgi:hypothetical protein